MFTQLPNHSTSQELGFMQESLEAFLDDFEGFRTDDIVTKVDLNSLDEQLNELYYDIEDTRRRLDAAQYLATTSFVPRGKGVKLDNATKLAKAKDLLKKVGIAVSDKDLPIILDYYNKYFKSSYNAYTQFDDGL